MAKPKHLEILQKGAKAWNKWRRKNPQERPNLYNGQLMELDLHGMNLSATDLSEANLMGANLKGADLSHGNLMGANLSEADLTKAKLKGAILTGGRLMGANLMGANLSTAKLNQVDFSDANLTNANLSQAELRDASVKGANLRGANLKKADLTGTMLADAVNLTSQQLSVAVLDGGARGSDDLEVPQERIAQPLEDLSAGLALVAESPPAPAPEKMELPEEPPAAPIRETAEPPEEPPAAPIRETAEPPEEPPAAPIRETAEPPEEPPPAPIPETAKPKEFMEPGRSPGAPTDAVPTLSDDPTEIDELGGRPFAQILAARIHEVWARRKAKGTVTGRTEEVPGDAFGVLIHGPWGSGKTSVLNFLRQELSSGAVGKKWLVVDFNAWRHQQIGPSWWALLNAIYRKRHRELRKISLWRSFRLMISDRLWRFQAGRAHHILMGALILWAIWFTTGMAVGTSAEIILRTLAGLMTLWGLGVLLGRFLLMGSRRSAKIFMEHHRDPVAVIVRHFRKMVQGACQPFAVFIDDLDRCHGSYVVELLQGIQTLFHDSNVVFVVAADRKWLRASYEHSYQEYKGSIGGVGRSLSDLFLAKMFQISAPVPQMAVTTQRQYWDHLLRIRESQNPKAAKAALRSAEKEAARIIGKEKDEDALMWKIREYRGDLLVKQAMLGVAAKRVMKPAARKETEHLLQPFVDLLEPNPRAMKRFVNAYALRKAIALLGDCDIEREPLVLWTLMELRWPVLADYLTDHPEMVEKIGSEPEPDGIPPDVRKLFTDSDVVAVVQGNDPVKSPALDKVTIRRIVAGR